MEDWKELMDEYDRICDEYEKVFNERMGFPESLSAEQTKKAIEVMKKAIERGSEMTFEEYYGEIMETPPELLEKLKRGETII